MQTMHDLGGDVAFGALNNIQGQFAQLLSVLQKQSRTGLAKKTDVESLRQLLSWWFGVQGRHIYVEYNILVKNRYYLSTEYYGPDLITEKVLMSWSGIVLYDDFLWHKKRFWGLLDFGTSLTLEWRFLDYTNNPVLEKQDVGSKIP